MKVGSDWCGRIFFAHFGTIRQCSFALLLRELQASKGACSLLTAADYAQVPSLQMYPTVASAVFRAGGYHAPAP